MNKETSGVLYTGDSAIRGTMFSHFHKGGVDRYAGWYGGLPGETMWGHFEFRIDGIGSIIELSWDTASGPLGWSFEPNQLEEVQS